MINRVFFFEKKEKRKKKKGEVVNNSVFYVNKIEFLNGNFFVKKIIILKNILNLNFC